MMKKQLSFEIIMDAKKLSKIENDERLSELASVLMDAYEELSSKKRLTQSKNKVLLNNQKSLFGDELCTK